MTRLTSRLAIVAGLTLAIACFSQVAAGGFPKSDSKVKATATATKPGADGKQTVTITLAIEKEWYIYTNPVGEDMLEGVKTKVSFKAKDKLTSQVAYPAGKLKTDVIDEKTTLRYFIYQNQVMIQAQVQRTPGDTSPLTISIDVNACHPGKGPKGDGAVCLQKGVVTLTVP